MNIEQKLVERAIAADLPLALAEDAVVTYGQVVAWLGDDDSPLAKANPRLFPQGSFRIGTPTRPVEGDYDIDLVCRLEFEKSQVSQRDLKALVGDRLKASATFEPRLRERRRCWTLNYERFHLDILPAIPDEDDAGDGLLITDRKLVRWQHTDPVGYANWFFGRPGASPAGSALADPEAAVDGLSRLEFRGSLQRAIQLMKRHRDLRFDCDDSVRPRSILLTTLAAKVSRGEPNLFEAMESIARRLPDGIEKRDGSWWVPSPAEPDENFAEEWNAVPGSRRAFDTWLAELRSGLTLLNGAASETDADRVSNRMFGPMPSVASTHAPIPTLAESSHAERVPWPLAVDHRCELKGSVYSGFKKGRRLWELSSRPLPKGVGLRFEATTNVPPPFEVRWQVVNTGQEARDANQLRGRFEDGNSDQPTVRWERTLYRGTHWIEAFVIKNAICRARSGRRLVRVS